MCTAPQSFVSCLLKMHINGFGGLNEMSAGREAERRLKTEARVMPRVQYWAVQAVNPNYEKFTNQATS